MTNAVTAGLTDAEVAQRVADGKTNDVPSRAARSVSDIVRGNVFTRINAILGVLLVIVLSTGSAINGLFGLLIIANSGIGIIQDGRHYFDYHHSAADTLDKVDPQELKENAAAMAVRAYALAAMPEPLPRSQK